MIRLETLAAKLRDTLNGEELENITEYGLDSVIPGTVYLFNVCLDTAMYKKAERTGNTVIRYINALMTLVDNSVEGSEETVYNAVIDTRVEFLVPLPEGAEESENGANTLLSRVRDLLTSVLQASVQDPLEDDDKTVYLHTISYSIANTGTRQQKELVGDCISLGLDISHQLVAAGVSSDSYSIEVEGESVRFSRAGFARRTISEANVPSDAANPSSSSVPSSTVLTLRMSLITRLDPIDRIIDDYIFEGALTPIEVTVARKRRGGSSSENVSSNYTMILDEAGLNLELNLAASSDIVLVEYFGS